MDSSAMKEMWDRRFGEEAYAYGTDPNEFLVSVADRIPKGRVLSLAEGEGRNGVFLAKLGHDVLGVDASANGLAKARKLAAREGVTIRTELADLAAYAIEPGAWDGIVSIFCHVPPEVRAPLHRAVVAGLKPGGAFVLEAYTPRQLSYGTGGPPTEHLMMNLPALRKELHGLDLEHAVEREREIVEGLHHTGLAHVVQIVGVKR